MERPGDWNTLPIYKKIQIYGKNLNEDYAKYVNKLEAKKIVKEICGEDIEIPRVIKIINNIQDGISCQDLNINHIIKSAHGSGWNINISENTKIEDVIKRLNSWNMKFNPLNEKQYSYINPTFFIEEKINDSVIGITGDALVYMIRCIHGNPISISVKYKKTQNSYDFDWNLKTPTTQTPIGIIIPKPRKLDLMLKLAKKLSKPFEFVRIDFYIGENDLIYFSEFTFTPAAGYQVFDLETEMYQGSLWN
jgi:hypothetical protein